MTTVNEKKISKLEATLVEKDEFIRKQWNTIDKLTAERDELVKKNEFSDSQQDEIKNERKLLAILLEREAERMKELPIDSRGMLNFDTIGLSGSYAIVISNGKVKIADLPFHTDVKITTYKGRVTRVNWEEGEEF